MARTYYNVVITSLTGVGAEGSGFIDSKKVEHYMVDGAAPVSVAASINKERANIRYDNLIGKLGLAGNVYISNVIATGANASTAPSSFSFTMESEHGDDCLTTVSASNEPSPGTVLTGANAIKRVVARSLIENRIDFGDYYDPTLKAAFIANASTVDAVRVGTRIERVVANAVANSITVAEAAITVEIDPL